MNKLRISLIEGSLLDDFQLIDISVISNREREAIFQGKIDLSELISWLIENEHEIKSIDIPINREGSGSLARKIRHFYENMDKTHDVVVDAMFEYRSNHCLRFACRGTNFPEIYIGKSKHNYEISLSDNDSEWMYFIDIEDFFNHLNN